MQKTIERRNSRVVQVHFEINHALNDRLSRYVDLYRMSKRDILSEALLLWLNAQDVIADKKVV